VAANSTLNRLELSRDTPTKYRKIAYEPAAIGTLFVDIFLEADDPLAKAPPRKQRFGGPLALSKVHWLRPELVAEITYLSWSDDGLLPKTVFVGLRADKAAKDVRRETSA
jgi:bifunctional non-homologous end joining protein LigD